MNLKRMLHKCERDQWSVFDLDWTVSPRELSKEDEIAIVQYFTDMSGIERLAGALFLAERQQVSDPTLRAILKSFVVDELRHSRTAEMLADYYNINNYQEYSINPHLLKFMPHFVNAIHMLSPEVANAYVTAGEIILDIALLRSLNDYVDDTVSHEAMKRINRDESRHIAIDFHMAEFYSSPEYDVIREKRSSPTVRRRIKAWWTFVNVLYYAAPFFKEVLFKPMDLTDPTGKRMLEAFKRIQLVANKPNIRRLPFVKFILTLQDLFNDPIVGAIFGRVILRVVGVDPRVFVKLYTDAERKRVSTMTLDALAQETLAAKQTTA